MQVTMPAHYSIDHLTSDGGMAALKETFPDGKANELNFCLFSTSGVHGSYLTIEEVAESLGADEPQGLTVLIVQPRLVRLRYGTITVTEQDMQFLKSLRSSSVDAVKKIGW